MHLWKIQYKNTKGYKISKLKYLRTHITRLKNETYLYLNSIFLIILKISTCTSIRSVLINQILIRYIQ